MVDDEKARKIDQYKLESNKFPTIQYYVDKEMEEDKEHKNIMEAEEEELSRAREQKGCSSSTCQEAQVPSRNGHESNNYLKNKRRVPNDNAAHQESLKKHQKMTKKIEEKHQQPNKKKEEKRGNKSKPPTPPREMPIGLRRAVAERGSTTPVWLIEKELTTSDTNSGQGRLLLRNCYKVLEKFMTEAEMEEVVVEKGSTKKNKGLNVLVFTEGEQFDLDFKQWKSFHQYVLTRNWNKIVKSFELKPELDVVQLWCFRLAPEKGSEICFAINVVETQRDSN